MSDKAYRLGVVGCGGFGLFALQHFTQVPGVELVGIANTHREAAYAACNRFGIPDPVDLDELLERFEVDMVYIATPPFLHYPQAMKALTAGKHVICEKPLALTVEQGREMIGTARENDLMLTVNLMQRYNPIYQKIHRIVQGGMLGELLHAYFENYATDEFLPPEHWFWDRSKSGGIFIEHGVHFFDIFEGWLGPGRVEAAQFGYRPGTEIEEHVHCTARYRSGALVNFYHGFHQTSLYHGFHQTSRMDRQEIRLLFERGDVTLYGWVPTLVKIHAIVDEKDTRRLCELFPGARLDVTSIYPPGDRACQGRHKSLDVYQMIELTAGLGDEKMHRYGELLRALLTDQLEWIEDRQHRRVISGENGLNSLEMAADADRLAHGIS